jgi:DNA-binding transcriptional ArsR family regulator
MKEEAIVQALGALAQESRLEVFRLLVRKGPEGVAAGEIAQTLDLAPPTLSFHLAQLRHAGLVRVRRLGRSLVYAADRERMTDVMAFLFQNCCADPSAGSRTPTKKKTERAD